MRTDKTFLSKKEMPQEDYQKRIIRTMYVTNPIWQYITFIPLMALVAYFAIVYLEMPWWRLLIGLLASAAFWTFFEYAMHRYFFHANPNNSWMRKVLDSIHWAHHEYPNDKRMMLVNPLLGIPATALVYGLAYLFIGQYAHPFIVGVMGIYLVYDWFHFASHNKNYNNAWFQLMKRHHLKHHYQDPTKNYAFTTTIWDKILDTEIRSKSE